MERARAYNVKFHFDNVHFDDPVVCGDFRMMQAGDIATHSQYVCGVHRQVVYEISYIVSGEGWFIVDGAEYPVRKNVVFINRPGQEHDIVSTAKDPLRYYYLGFEFIPNEDANGDLVRLQRFLDHGQSPMAVADGSVKSAFASLFEDIILEDFLSPRLIGDDIFRILSATWRSFESNTRRVYLPETNGEKSRLVAEVVHYIDTNCEKIDALKNLSDVFGYSYSSISLAFVRSMGQSLRDYFLMRRFEQACRYLDSGESVTAVSDALGYSSIHAFSHAFYHHYGISPKEYQKRRKQQP